MRSLAALVSFVALSALAQDSSQSADRTVAGVLGQPTWVAEAKQCPSDFALRGARPDEPEARDCSSEGACLTACGKGDGWSCYWLGVALNSRGAPEAASEILYQQACKLGVSSGCTNRAAGVLVESRESATAQSCAARSFALTCEREDPWGCTMYAYHLSEGIGVPKDPELALRALANSCRFGPDDEACARANAMRQSLLRQQKLPTSPEAK